MRHVAMNRNRPAQPCLLSLVQSRLSQSQIDLPERMRRRIRDFAQQIRAGVLIGMQSWHRQRQGLTTSRALPRHEHFNRQGSRIAGPQLRGRKRFADFLAAHIGVLASREHVPGSAHMLEDSGKNSQPGWSKSANRDGYDAYRYRPAGRRLGQGR